jgi:hypothetical protein
MIRTQIQLTEQQARTLRRLASSQGRSLAQLIRTSVEFYLARGGDESKDLRIERALKAAGRFASGSSDGSAKHDRHLAGAFRA